MSFSATLLMLKAKEGQSLLGNHYNPGFRLGTGSSIGNWIMGFSFTHYESSDPIQDALKVNFALNDYELAFTRPYTVEKTVRLEPFLGAEYARTRRNFLWNQSTVYNCKFDGTGPQIGLRAFKELVKGISLKGSLTQSALWGRTNWGSHKKRKLAPITKLSLGVEWGLKRAQGQRIYLAAGYEGQYWINELASGDFSKNLGLQGFTAQAKVDF
ncbi:Lpg1974 family pore-forming outer membrane protein [Candidatus Neptunochlamydia vexilliferae]|uniref:Uncharacterized protein n=1 Tax=Candidatus Neptunichlamydia vexilliferae TaxID=1651774 RepID=A0ABS0B2D7_9BACT|nr:Lpg1974 family pore-forming outer membrane protein [Candidatus Neptunochlamydia vexilliferae]MBF5060037.1 hypothetical protein [Candidatus Neptunochlamydia vexilliferae]